MVMEIGGISKYIKDLIIDHDKVEVPHLGIFFAREQPAHFSENRTAIYPPSRTLTFSREDLEWTSCDLLVQAVAAGMALPQDSAVTELEWGIGRLLSELETNGLCVLPGLGEIKTGENGTYSFEPYDNLDICPESLGLEPVAIKPLPVEGEENRKKIKRQKRRSARLAVVLAIMVAVALFFISVYCFRDQLAPFSEMVISAVDDLLNHILYTSEERALLGF